MSLKEHHRRLCEGFLHFQNAAWHAIHRLPRNIIYRLSSLSLVTDLKSRLFHLSISGCPILLYSSFYLNRNFESRFKSLVGAAHSMRSACERLGKRWAQGIRDCERYFSPPAAS
ncbi:hypothetical protein [Microbulbifer rhizosphaerae]|uniref:Uncharacterized protein n=1 Tax=Microbulbifer rhizosphaerae TaxID=1562603 RepID=A0A7W4WB78_9GAMM|nr:hypothetical protein [Microbulbifer rhizosphaerae]MBB3060487.1 hypothetical protein [Microbulbifer rhizosphaerae]